MTPNVMLKFAVKQEQRHACLAMPSVSKLNKVNFVSASHCEPFLVLLRGQILN